MHHPFLDPILGLINLHHFCECRFLNLLIQNRYFIKNIYQTYLNGLKLPNKPIKLPHLKTTLFPLMLPHQPLRLPPKTLRLAHYPSQLISNYQNLILPHFLKPSLGFWIPRSQRFVDSGVRLTYYGNISALPTDFSLTNRMSWYLWNCRVLSQDKIALIFDILIECKQIQDNCLKVGVTSKTT